MVVADDPLAGGGGSDGSGSSDDAGDDKDGTYNPDDPLRGPRGETVDPGAGDGTADGPDGGGSGGASTPSDDGGSETGGTYNPDDPLATGGGSDRRTADPGDGSRQTRRQDQGRSGSTGGTYDPDDPLRGPDGATVDPRDGGATARRRDQSTGPGTTMPDRSPTGTGGTDAPPTDRELGPMADWKRDYASQFERFGPEDVRFRRVERPGGEFSQPYIPASIVEDTLQEDVASQSPYVDPSDVVVSQTEDGTYQASVPEERIVENQREALRQQAAEQWDVAPSRIAIVREGDQLRAGVRGDGDDVFPDASVGGTVENDFGTGTVTQETTGQRSVRDFEPGTTPSGLGEVAGTVAQRTVEDPVGYVGGGTANFLTETARLDVDESLRSEDMDPSIASRLPGPAGDAAGYIGRSIDEGVRQFDRAGEVWDESVARGAERYEQAGVPTPVAGFVEQTGRIVNPAAAAADTVRATEAGTYVVVGAADGPGELAARAGEVSDQTAYLAGSAVTAAQEDPSLIPAAAAGGLALGGVATGAVRASRAGAASVRAGRIPGRTILRRVRSAPGRARSGAANVASRTRAAAGEARARSPVGIEIDADAGLVEVSDDFGANAAGAVRGTAAQARSAAGSTAARARRGVVDEPDAPQAASGTGTVRGAVERLRGSDLEDAPLVGDPRVNPFDRLAEGIQYRIREAARASIRRRQRDLGELEVDQDPLAPYEPLQGSVRIGSRDWSAIPREAAGAVRSAAPSPIRATRAELRSARFRATEELVGPGPSPVERVGSAAGEIWTTATSPVRVARREARSARFWATEQLAGPGPTPIGRAWQAVPSRQGLSDVRDITIRVGSRSDAERPTGPTVADDLLPGEEARQIGWRDFDADESTRRFDDADDATNAIDETTVDVDVDGGAGQQQAARTVVRQEGDTTGTGTEFDLRGPMAGSVTGLATVGGSIGETSQETLATESTELGETTVVESEPMTADLATDTTQETLALTEEAQSAQATAQETDDRAATAVIETPATTQDTSTGQDDLATPFTAVPGQGTGTTEITTPDQPPWRPKPFPDPEVAPAGSPSPRDDAAPWDVEFGTGSVGLSPSWYYEEVTFRATGQIATSPGQETLAGYSSGIEGRDQLPTAEVLGDDETAEAIAGELDLLGGSIGTPDATAGLGLDFGGDGEDSGWLL